MPSPFAGPVVTLVGIVGPSLLLTLGVRRWLEPVRWRYVALFLALVLLFLGRAVFTSDLPVPVDEVARGYPYRGLVGPVTPANPLTNDTVKLFLPWMQVVREELSHGRFPLWNRYAFSGYPLLGNGESAPFSPLFLVTLFVLLPKQIVAMAGLKLFVALLFTYLFCRYERLSDAASCFAGIAFAFSTSQTVYLYYSTVSVTAFLPAALYAVSIAMSDGREVAGRVSPPRERGLLLMAMIVATILANGHPESVLHIAIGVLALMLINMREASGWKEWVRKARGLVIAAIGGLLLSAPAWAPTLSEVLVSERLAVVRRSGYGSFPLTALWALVSPNGFGNPVRHNWNWILNYPLVAYSYVGLIPLALIITAVLVRSTTGRVRWLIAAAVVLFIVAMNWTPVGHVVNTLPPFSVAANDKLRFVSVFFALVAAAHVIDRRERLSRIHLTIVALAVAGLAAYAYWKQAALMRPIDLAGAAAVLLLTAAPRPVWAAALTGLELFALNAPFNAPTSARYFRPDLPIVRALRRMAPPEPFRVVGLDWTFLPNAAAQYGLEDIRGSDPMALASYQRFFDRIAVRDATSDVKRVVDVDQPAVDFLNVLFVMGEPGTRLGSRWRQVYDGSDGTLFRRVDPIQRFFVPSQVVEAGDMKTLLDSRAAVASDIVRPRNGEAGITSLLQGRPDEFELIVDAQHEVMIASSEPLAPGWTIEVGKGEAAIHPVNGAFIGFLVPGGRSSVRVRYRPRSFYATWAGPFAGLLIMTSVAWKGRRREEVAPTATGKLSEPPADK